MNDYISRQEAMDAIHDHYEVRNPEQNALMDEVSMLIFRLPPVDVRPVRRGRWIVHMNELFPADSTIECDQCHEVQTAFISDSFCPNCGADMRGDAE